MRRRRAVVALARSFYCLEPVDFLQSIFLGVLAGGSQSHDSLIMFRLFGKSLSSHLIIELTGCLKCYIFCLTQGCPLPSSPVKNWQSLNSFRLQPLFHSDASSDFVPGLSRTSHPARRYESSPALLVQQTRSASFVEDVQPCSDTSSAPVPSLLHLSPFLHVRIHEDTRHPPVELFLHQCHL